MHYSDGLLQMVAHCAHCLCAEPNVPRFMEILGGNLAMGFIFSVLSEFTLPVLKYIIFMVVHFLL